MAKKLFVGGLAWTTTDETLSALFAKAGTVTSANVVKDRYTGKSRGFGFVEMSSDEEADKAVAELNGQALDGRNISVNEARPREPRNDNFSRREDNRGE
ncbi:MAG: RNA-binding protein [Candidatus Levybacteria bacterium RIFCSPHIGHO2_01_FULL_40_15b]|nr:MAG: RNA-binding protein [Candidatus Levybacteria bacterium RIFCSPHIGHO2_01_FULL_40_15b]